jgi:SAM-dependent methyltransferase
MIEKIKTKRAAQNTWGQYEYRHTNLMSVETKERDLFIDAGCGGGETMRIMDEKKVGWKRIVGFDLNPYSIDTLNELGYEAYCQSVCEPCPQIEDGTADYICFAESFEHVDSDYETFQNFSRWLKPGGIMYMSAQPIGSTAFVDPKECIASTKEAIETILNKFGLEIVQYKGPDITGAKHWIWTRKT